MLVTTDDGLKKYLSQVLSQISQWLLNKDLQKLVLVVTSVDTGEVLERWVFNIEADESVTIDRYINTTFCNHILNSGSKIKSEKEIHREIQAIIRQITASVTFLPLLEGPCTFDLLVYTNKNTKVPQSWEESDPKFIQNSTEVRLRSFTTKVHKVDTLVSFKERE